MYISDDIDYLPALDLVRGLFRAIWTFAIKLYAKIVSNVDLKLLTMLAKRSNTFWRIKLEYENDSLILIIIIQTTWRIQKPHRKKFWWKYIKNESRKSYLVNKEWSSIILVVSWSQTHFGFPHSFFTWRIRRDPKIIPEQLKLPWSVIFSSVFAQVNKRGSKLDLGSLLKRFLRLLTKVNTSIMSFISKLK